MDSSNGGRTPKTITLNAMKPIIYHNPRCSKSRETLSLLAAHQIDCTVVEYLKEPPALTTLQALLAALGGDIGLLVRRKEPTYAALKLEAASPTQILQAIAEHPILLERPIVVDGTRAVVGRPPERVLALFVK